MVRGGILVALWLLGLSPVLCSTERDAIIARFQKYLQINTSHPSPDYAKAAEYIISIAKSLGLEHETVEFVTGKPVVILKWQGRSPKLSALLLNSHTDVVPAEEHRWIHSPFSAHIDSSGNIYSRGSQDMKCVGMQYLEAIRQLMASGFEPKRSVYVSFVPDEEIGGDDGARLFANSERFKKLNIGFVLDEGLASWNEYYRVFYAERSPWWLVIKATGPSGHGSKLYDNSVMENLMRSVECIRRFRASQFDMVKSGVKAEGEVTSVNMVFLKAGTPSPTGFIMNLQPSNAEAGFDIRIPPTASPEHLEEIISQQWAPLWRNMTFEFKQKVPVLDKSGKPVLTVANRSNSWWMLLETAVRKGGGQLMNPEVFPASTDARYFRELGLPAFGFSPMSHTPVLLHDHNEYLNQEVYLKGIVIYKAIIREFTSADDNIDDEVARDDL